MNQYITVRNGYPGQLVYTSKRTGEKFFWEHYGDEQDIQLMELRNARNTSKKFFDHNWFVFDEEYDWVIDFLGVRAFYNNIINLEGIDALLKKTPKKIEKELATLTNGQKRTVAYRAMEMIRNKEIDVQLFLFQHLIKVRIVACVRVSVHLLRAGITNCHQFAIVQLLPHRQMRVADAAESNKCNLIHTRLSLKCSKNLLQIIPGSQNVRILLGSLDFSFNGHSPIIT